MVKNDRRKNNPGLDAVALAKGLKRRRDDKINDIFYYGILSSLIVVVTIFFLGSFFISK